MEPTFSPDRTVRVDWTVEDGRMSHVIEMPTVVWAATGARILDMGWDWDGSLRWRGLGNAFVIQYRRYAQGGSITVWVEPDRGIFRFGGEEGKQEPLATIHTRLQEVIELNTAGDGVSLAAAGSVPQRSPQTALLIFMGWIALAFLVIGFAVWKFGIQRPRSNAPSTPPKLLRTIPTPAPFNFDKDYHDLRERHPAKADGEEPKAPR